MIGLSNVCFSRICFVFYSLLYYGCGFEKIVLFVVELCDGCVVFVIFVMFVWNFGLSLIIGVCCLGGEFELFVGGLFLMVLILVYYK